jgi:hypothetical protein
LIFAVKPRAPFVRHFKAAERLNRRRMHRRGAVRRRTSRTTPRLRTIANFRYGQKRGFFVWDDMSWFGEGDVVRVANDD